MSSIDISVRPVRLNNIQALRGIAALGVMAAHLLQIERKYSHDSILHEGLMFGMAGVDLFFLISGFIMVYITQTTQNKGRDISQFLFARGARVYPLYWVVTFTLIVLYLIRPDMVFIQSAGEPNLMKSIFLWPEKAPPILELGWTLIHEMGFYIIFALLLWLPQRLRLYGIFIWTVFVIIGLGLDLNEINDVLGILINPLTFEFLTGAIIAYLYLHLERLPAWPFVLMGGLALSVSVNLWKSPIIDLFGNEWTRVIYFTPALSLIVLGLLYLERANKIMPRWIVTLGDWSYALYLTHVLSLSLIGYIWRPLGQSGYWDNIYVIVLMIFITIIVAGLTYKFIEKPLIDYSLHLRKRWF